jgi:hypothetical protein
MTPRATQGSPVNEPPPERETAHRVTDQGGSLTGLRATLHCQLCGRPIGGLTGLDEIQSLIAHMAEHHDLSLDTIKALGLREEWEQKGARH